LNPVTGRKVKVAGLVLAIAFVCVAMYLGIPHLTGGVHNLPANAASSPMALMEWTLRGVGNDEPQKLYNALGDDYRAVFGRYFDRVRAGQDQDLWLAAAVKAGVAKDLAGLKELPDQRMFLAWWNLSDRSAVDFELPLFFRRSAQAAESAIILKVFYETRDVANAKTGFVLYQMDKGSDIVRTVRVGDGWRIDIPGDIPPGL